MARQARRAATLVSGASLRGIVFDACANNCIPNTFGMLQHFGIANRNRVCVSESPHLDTAALANALRIDEAEVLSRRYPPHGLGHRVFYGLHVLKTRIETRVRRFSPAAIAAGVLHHPATHELRDLPFSTVGWDMLQERCFCTNEGIRQGWVTVNGAARCDGCGGNLAKIEPVMVPDELRIALALVAGLVDPDPAKQKEALNLLPPDVRNASRTLIYDIIMNLAYGTSHKQFDPDQNNLRTTALANACIALMKWPDGLLDFSPPAHVPQHRWEWARRHYGLLDAFAHDPLLTVVRSTRGKSNAAEPHHTTSRTGRVPSKRISTRAAALLGSVDENGLKNAWDSGKFTQHFWSYNGARVRAFDPAEVLAIAPLLRIIKARANAALLMGMPVYGVEQLLACGLMAPVKPSPGVRQRHAYFEAAHTLIDQLEAYPKRDVTDPVRFTEAIRHVSGRPKPWGLAIKAMLDGKIAFSLGEESSKRLAPVIRRLLVSADAIPALMQLTSAELTTADMGRADMWSQEDALECLNGNRSVPGPLAGLECVGFSPKLYRVADILERAAVGVTTSDLARRSRRDPKRTVILLNENSVPQIAPGLWARERAEQVALHPFDHR